MAYDQNVVDAFNRAIQSTGASPRVAKALYEAGLVESGLRNLNYGDRDSVGALQQRPSQGWQHATDPYQAALDFISHATQANATGRYGSAGSLAQAVQRSAFPGRYDQQSSLASRLLGGASFSPGSGTTPSAGGAVGSTVPSAPGDAGQAGDFAGLLQTLLAKPHQQVQAGQIAPPSFSASPALPQGFQALTPSAQPGPQQERPVSQALGLLETLRGSEGSPGMSQASSGAQTAPASPTSIADKVAGDRNTRGFTGSGVLELIYNDGGKGYGIKNGQVVNGQQVYSDVWAGHANHVHVAAGPKTVVELGKLAQSLGLHVGENPHFGGVNPVHVQNSLHYKGEAIDVSGDPAKMAEFARQVEAYNKTHKI